MNPSPSPVAPVQSSPRKISPGQVLLIGRCMSARKPQGGSELWTHLIVLPAPDAYSSPATVEVLAKRRLADKEEDVEVLCRVGGFRRQYNSRPDEDGVIKKITTADNKLFAIED
jgi:hypothetical protein